MSVQTLLLVDDRKENLIALDSILEEPNRRLLHATSGNEALSILLREDVSLVMLDVQMPEMDGFEVAELMRKNKKTQNVPIIFATALQTENRWVFKGYECGAVDYLFKPIEPEILRIKVDVFLQLDMQKRLLQKALQDLKRLQEQNEQMLKSIGEGVISVNEKGDITFVNPAARLLATDKVALSVGSAVEGALFLDKEGRKAFKWDKSDIVGRCKNNERVMLDEYYCWHGDALVPIEMTISPVTSKKNQFSGVVILFRSRGGIEARDREREDTKAMRRVERRKLHIELGVFDPESGSNKGRLVNITSSGMKLYSRAEYKEGDIHDFAMVLPETIEGTHTLRLRGICVWSEYSESSSAFGAGFKFQNPSQESLKIIEVLLEKY